MKKAVAPLLLLALVGCTPPDLAVGAGAAVMMYATRSDDNATTATKSASGEVWCYRTLGYPECYPTPQNVVPERLINVEPQSKYPSSYEAYNKLIEKEKAAPVHAPTPPQFSDSKEEDPVALLSKEQTAAEISSEENEQTDG